MDQIPKHELSRLEAIAGPSQPLEELVARRLDGEPLQYIEGSAPFASLDLIVDERVLVPRPETELLFEMAIRLVRNPEVIVDLCTGSGALALALKKEFPHSAVFATDISEEAIEVAAENRHHTRLDIYLAAGDLFDPLPASLLGEVDLLVANPPYVSETEFESLPDDVKREPKMALVAGRTGLEIIQRIGATASRWLRPGGVVVCEIGETQGVSASASFLGLATVVRQDLTHRDRYVVAVKP
ncbi:MAG TPA: peptide chain release factor N(5)-glutamine methyltransferase [Acidimicrobiia bacterium]|nr:peptide chain release factor N(5)-glutamine methyltransferase [Acidimicrobiia bacterium]